MTLVSEGHQILREKGPMCFLRNGTAFVAREAVYRTYGIGSGRVCPVCGFSGRKFRPFGPREEAMCPTCGAKERHRLLWHYIQHETDLTAGGNHVLWFAPTTRLPELLRACGNEITTTDLTLEGVDVHADITRLPFGEATFDAIICSHVLEHIPDDRAAMSELYRILSPGGDALVMVPKDKQRDETYEDDTITSLEDRREAFGQGDHVRLYGNDFVRRLADAGFDVSVNTYAESLSEEHVDRYGLKVSDRSAYFGSVEREPSIREKYEDVHHLTK